MVSINPDVKLDLCGPQLCDLLHCDTTFMKSPLKPMKSPWIFRIVPLNSNKIPWNPHSSQWITINHHYIIPTNPHVIPMKSPWNHHKIPMKSPWNCHEILASTFDSASLPMLPLPKWSLSSGRFHAGRSAFWERRPGMDRNTNSYSYGHGYQL